MATRRPTTYLKLGSKASTTLTRKAASEQAIKERVKAKADRITKAMKSANSKTGMFKSL